ncbi:MAG TPA: hypothetical protein VH741_02335 [Candidatus Limnocylindrales bacterium]
MIHNAVIHLAGKLPVLADLRAAPSPSDQALLCTNLRTRDGKKPSFIDDTNAWFLIPIHEVTILELPEDTFDPSVDAAPPAADAPQRRRPKPTESDLGVVMLGPGPEPDYGAPLEPDEDLLARIRAL